VVQLGPLGWKVVLYENCDDQCQLLVGLVGEDNLVRIHNKPQQLILYLTTHLFCQLQILLATLDLTIRKGDLVGWLKVLSLRAGDYPSRTRSVLL